MADARTARQNFVTALKATMLILDELDGAGANALAAAQAIMPSGRNAAMEENDYYDLRDAYVRMVVDNVHDAREAVDKLQYIDGDNWFVNTGLMPFTKKDEEPF